MEGTSSYQSASSLHQRLEDILRLFSRAGILVVESRLHASAVDLVLNKPVESSLFKEIYRELLDRYGLLAFQLNTVPPIVRIVEYRAGPSKLEKYKWLLAAMTIITVFLTGLELSRSLEELQHVTGGTQPFNKYWTALLYTVFFLVALLSHELGHIYTSKRAGVHYEGPILLPAPPIQLGFIGTFGAIIFTKTLPCSRRDLARIGISGPLAGFLVGTIIGVIGLHLSPVLPPEMSGVLIEEGFRPIPVSTLMLELLLRSRVTSGVVVMHPLLFIAYVVYLVTFLNLLPIGQLDGGHVVRSFTSIRTHQYIGIITPVVFLTIGSLLMYFFNVGHFYIGLGLLALVLWAITGRAPHLGVANWYDTSRCVLCLVLYFALLILTLPLPLL